MKQWTMNTTSWGVGWRILRAVDGRDGGRPRDTAHVPSATYETIDTDGQDNILSMISPHPRILSNVPALT